MPVRRDPRQDTCRSTGRGWWRVWREWNIAVVVSGALLVAIATAQFTAAEVSFWSWWALAGGITLMLAALSTGLRNRARQHRG